MKFRGCSKEVFTNIFKSILMPFECLPYIETQHKSTDHQATFGYGMAIVLYNDGKYSSNWQAVRAFQKAGVAIDPYLTKINNGKTFDIYLA